jgi:hypothetical protein
MAKPWCFVLRVNPQWIRRAIQTRKDVLYLFARKVTKGERALADEINLEAGDAAENVNAGKRNVQQNPRQQSRSDPSQNQRGGDMYVSQQDGSQWVIAQILDHAQQIRELAYRLDNLPAKFAELKEQVQKLADVEIIVSPSAVVIKPTPPPDAITLSSRMLLRILIISGVIIAGLVVYLIYTGAPHG